MQTLSTEACQSTQTEHLRQAWRRLKGACNPSVGQQEMIVVSGRVIFTLEVPVKILQDMSYPYHHALRIHSLTHCDHCHYMASAALNNMLNNIRCRLININAISESVMNCCQLGCQAHIKWYLNRNTMLISKCTWLYQMQKGGHFVRPKLAKSFLTKLLQWNMLNFSFLASVPRRSGVRRRAVIRSGNASVHGCIYGLFHFDELTIFSMMLSASFHWFETSWRPCIVTVMREDDYAAIQTFIVVSRQLL